MADSTEQKTGLLHLSLKEALIIEKQHHGTSINDKLERGKGTGVIWINTGRAGVSRQELKESMHIDPNL